MIGNSGWRTISFLETERQFSVQKFLTLSRQVFRNRRSNKIMYELIPFVVDLEHPPRNCLLERCNFFPFGQRGCTIQRLERKTVAG